jgi:hypothetical protein
MVFGLALVLLGALLLTGCDARARVGELRTESQTVELGDAESVRVEINFGAGNLEVTGGAEKLLEADFTYNVAKLKPVVEYVDGTLVVRQPETNGLPGLRNITDFRNEWGLRLNDQVPMNLSVDMGAGVSNLRLDGLSLNRLDVNVGAGESTVDLSGDWARDLAVNIDGGAGDIIVQLPKDVGVRVEVDRGASMVEAPGLTKDGNVYTNAAFGVSDVTLQIDLKSGIGRVNLEIGQTDAPEATVE